MAVLNYAFKELKENMAKASGRNLNISPKQSIEICKYVRGRKVEQAKRLLQAAIAQKTPVPFTRFTNGLGHKAGMSAGRYHPKASEAILKVISAAEANAKNKGLAPSDLKIIHIAAQRGPKQWHYGRKRRSIMKNTHIEVVVAEVKTTATPKAKPKKVASPKTTTTKKE